MNYEVIQWARRHGVAPYALNELQAIFRLDEAALSVPQGVSEAAVQSVVRLEAGRRGVRLWRNNVGVLTNEKTGQPVRYGLGNDSPALNKVIKSADLIGWRSVTVTEAHIGTVIAQFVSRECKRVGWKYSGNAHELAQLKWAEVVVADGGDASFCTGEGTL